MVDVGRIYGRDLEVRVVIYELLMDGSEYYSVEVWLEWRRRGGERKKRRAMSIVHRILKQMEIEGQIVGRNVSQEEHGGKSGYARKYYRRSDKE